jgi:hypothetical protein
MTHYDEWLNGKKEQEFDALQGLQIEYARANDFAAVFDGPAGKRVLQAISRLAYARETKVPPTADLAMAQRATGALYWLIEQITESWKVLKDQDPKERSADGEAGSE